MRDLHTLHETLGELTALRKIRPPGRSYDDWRRFLEECREAGVAALTSEHPPRFANFLGPALLRRWRWVEESERMGIPFEEASRAFDAAIERDSDAMNGAMAHQQRMRQSAERERDAAKTGRRRVPRSADELFDYADEAIPK
jgi:hypothetical protein